MNLGQIDELGDVVSEVATAAYRRARAQLREGTLDANQFNNATRRYNDAMELATRLVVISLHEDVENIQRLTNDVRESCEQLKQAVGRIERASDSLKILGGALAFAASIVAAVANPALVTGAVAAGLNLGNTIHDVTSDD